MNQIGPTALGLLSHTITNQLLRALYSIPAHTTESGCCKLVDQFERYEVIGQHGEMPTSRASDFSSRHHEGDCHARIQLQLFIVLVLQMQQPGPLQHSSEPTNVNHFLEFET
ncbi:hypothetical protein Bbelb_194560 [Branchiostoma belcheri]|nr:hypothetical protein Bbelb_194560 [Branchiostoma belcheri]